MFWVGNIFVYILLRIQPIGIPLDRDEDVFGLLGRTILEGKLPYKAELKIEHFIKKYTRENYQIENVLFFSEKKQSWLSYQNETFLQREKHSNESIVFYRRVDQ
ncbi:MAG: hypothetical protein DHS20C09_15710 [marine bacterium B5-7]|nr:MAG: hypothetical protein DHS20C09_15710 [marine bacterium B5-7]